MKLTNRGTHRDLGYFFLGLIISFSISGIMLNHRASWNPTKYTIEERSFSLKFAPPKSEFARKEVEEMMSEIQVEDNIRRHVVRDSVLTVSLISNDVKLDLRTGEGEVVTYRKTPLISQIYTLHKTTNDWWIYYSDIFGAAMFIIAITGMYMYPKGNKFSFKSRGWKLAVAGVVFPLIFLFLLA